MSIKIEMLRCFAMVAKQGSLSDAAEALGRTPSAVSMMLKQFEDHIGAPLFETARKSRLTPLGELIHEEARRQVDQFENTVSVIEGLARSELGFLRLAVTPSVAAIILPTAMFEFTKAFPNVRIEIRDMDSGSIARELMQERADIGIGSLKPVEGMSRIELFSDAFGVVCRNDHPINQNRNNLTWQDLTDHVFIANGLCDLITDPGFAPILANSKMMVRNTASLFALVRENVGVTVLPRLAVAGIEDGLAFLPLTDAMARRNVHMMSQPFNLLLPAAREFLKLMEKLKKDGRISTRP